MFSIANFVRKFPIIAFFCLMRNISTIGYHVDTHRVARRIDLASCLGRFDIHRDTIIRTEESQSMGGKYLQGVGLQTLDECQRLCCESEGCDVFILEEKGEGFCYLFECGPPENFRCKFTRHANYTSAVLTPIRHVTSSPEIKVPNPPHSPQMPAASLSQHELELRNLKQNPDGNLQKITSTLIPPLGVRIGDQLTTPKSSVAKSSHCGRFQFQCHSGECIAVYNACDGIPQCEDGSDEGPECPTGSPVGTKASGSDVKNLETGSVSIQNVNRLSPSDVLLTNQIPSQRQYQQQAIPAPIINNREDPMSAPQIWPSHKIQDTQNDLEHNSHIFNHKGGLQIASNNYAQPYPNQGANMYGMQRDLYPPDLQDSAYRNIIVQTQDRMVPPNINWQQQNPNQQQIIANGQYLVHGQPAIQMKPMPGPPQDAYPPQQTVPAVSGQPEPVASNAVPNSKEKQKGSKHEHKTTSNSDESEEYEDYAEKSTEPPKKKQRKHKKISKDKDKVKITKTQKPADSPVHEQYKMIKNHLEIEFVDHDGQSERPGGAVLSLTLGIIVTAALAILVGCRMRTVGRRIRRNGKAPYAHDADFLVNGMYL